MKLYTGTGDRGKTSLFSGERVAKSNLRIDAYGNLDELNAVLGVVVVHIPEAHAEIINALRGIQSELFDMGAWLATVPGSPAARQLNDFPAENYQRLETAIDALESAMPELTGFILPGGHAAAAMAHVARTVCRRTERGVIRLLESEADNPDRGVVYDNILIYLNRLSDYLFSLARHLNILTKTPDVPWRK